MEQKKENFKRRQFKSKSRYLWSFLIATLIFVAGFGITYTFTYLEFQRVVGVSDPVSYQIFRDKLEYSLFGKDICLEESYLELTQDLAFQGQIIGDLELKLGRDNENVLFRKKFFTLVQMEHFEFVKLVNEECNKDINTILFFYSNEENDVDNSLDLGNILGVIYERNKDNLALYSIDLNLDSELVSLLREKYDVNSTVVIVNENHKFSQINNIDEVETYFLENYKDSIKIN